MEHPIYYRVLVNYNHDRAVIATLQDFDEIDYDHNRYITKQKFDTEEEALEFCQQAYKNPIVPQHVKTLLESLLTVHYNIDEYMTPTHVLRPWD